MGPGSHDELCHRCDGDMGNDGSGMSMMEAGLSTMDEGAGSMEGALGCGAMM